MRIKINIVLKMWEQNVNVTLINKTKLKKPIYIPFNFIFSKENVVYDVDLIFPDGSLLRNYRDEQSPIIPFAFEDYKVKNVSRKRNYQIKNEIIINNRKNQNGLLDEIRLDEKNKNSELRGNIDYGKLSNQIYELKKDDLLLNSNNKTTNENQNYQSKKYGNKTIQDYKLIEDISKKHIYLNQINEEDELNYIPHSKDKSDELKDNNIYEDSNNIDNKGNDKNKREKNFDYKEGEVKLENHNKMIFEKEYNNLEIENHNNTGFDNCQNIYQNNHIFYEKIKNIF